MNLQEKENFHFIFLVSRVLGVSAMVSNTTFSHNSAISYWSVLLVEETGVPGENHRPAASH